MNLDVIIVNYNSGALLRKCLDSIFAGNDRIALRIMTIDNASHDQSLKDAIASYPGLTIIRNRRNLGFARAVNQGIRNTGSDFILLVNPDAEIASGGIKAMLDFMSTHTDCGVLGGLVYYPNGKRQETARRFPTLATVVLGRRTSMLYRLFPGNPFSRRYLLLDADFSRARQVDFVAGTFMMLRREALNEVGLFDEDYFLYVEDADLCYRMKRHGWKVWFTPDARCTHLYGENIREDNIRPAVYHAQSMYRFLAKHLRPPPVLTLFIRTAVHLKNVETIAWGFFKRSFVR